LNIRANPFVGEATSTSPKSFKKISAVIKVGGSSTEGGQDAVNLINVVDLGTPPLIITNTTIINTNSSKFWDTLDSPADIFLNDLGDVDVASPTNGFALIFNSTTGNWEAQPVVEGSTFNSTYDQFAYNQSDGSFNATYEPFAYNQTEAGQSVFLNLSGTNADQNIDISPFNLTIGERLVFRLGEFISNTVDGWLRVEGSLNVTENTNLWGNATVRQNLTVIGHLHTEGNVTGSQIHGGMSNHDDAGITINISAINVFFNVTSLVAERFKKTDCPASV